MPITQLEKEILLCHVLKIERSKLFSHPERELTKSEQELYNKLTQRRKNNEPIAYIINNQPFMGLEFYVDQNVLIPRPETELLVEEVIKESKVHCPRSIVDVGTGSGCIAVTLAKNLPNSKVIAIDSSKAALEIAKKNAAANGVADQIDFRLGNMFEPLKEKIDLIVSNPPYIPTAEIDKLEPDVKNFEPRSALDGGPEGLKYIRDLIIQSPSLLTTQLPKRLFIEIGYDQAAALKQLGNFTITKDLSGHDRILAC